MTERITKEFDPEGEIVVIEDITLLNTMGSRYDNNSLSVWLSDEWYGEKSICYRIRASDVLIALHNNIKKFQIKKARVYHYLIPIEE